MVTVLCTGTARQERQGVPDQKTADEAAPMKSRPICRGGSFLDQSVFYTLVDKDRHVSLRSRQVDLKFSLQLLLWIRAYKRQPVL